MSHALPLPVCAMLLAVFAGTAVAADEKALLEAPLVDWSVARSTYQQIDKWVKNDKVDRDVSSRPLLVSGVTAVRVTLRFGGLTLAIGDASAGVVKPEAAVDLRELAARATELALLKYHEERDRAITRPQPGAKDKAPAPRRVEVIPLDVDLQIAHTAADVLIPESAPPKAIYFQFAAGYHALRLTSTADLPVSAMMWPGNALASNLLPDSQLTQMLRDIGVQPQDILTQSAKVGRAGGPRLERFEVIHLVRPFDGQPVVQLTRGGEVIPADAVDMGMVDAMGRRLAQHLSHRIVLEGKTPGALAGTYHSTSDRYDPVEAPMSEAALAAYAMSRRATQLGRLDANGLEYLNTKEKTRVIVDHLRKSLVNLKPTEGDAEAKALLLLTLIDAPFFAEHKVDRDRLGAALLGLTVEKNQFIHPTARTPLAADGQALILAALASLYEQTRDEKLPAVIEPVQDALWASKLTTLELVTAMPWMSMAAQRMHRVNEAQQTDDRERALERKRWGERVAAMRSLSENLRKKRLVRTAPALGPADVIGGYDLINETGEGVPTPDWRSAQVLAFLAHNAMQKDLMEGEKPAQLKYDATLTVRYLAQLMMDEPSCYYVRGSAGGRRDAIDGVRLALWDNRLAVKPTAMTLLAITDLQRAVAALDQR